MKLLRLTIIKFWRHDDMGKLVIGIFGGGNVTKGSGEWQAAHETGRLLAEHGVVVLTGGLGGVMLAASAGAKSGKGLTVGILPGDRTTSAPNSYVDIAIYTGMGEARNVLNVKSCNAAIAIGGEYGTLSEIALALKCRCPIILFDSWNLSRKGMTVENDILIAKNAVDAVNLALDAASSNS